MTDDRDSSRTGNHSVEVLTGPGSRRRWSAAEKARVVTESLAPGVGVSEAARRWHVGRRQVYVWRREAQAGLLTLPSELSQSNPPEPAFVPIVAEPAPRAAVLPAQPAVAPASTIEVEIAGAVVRVSRGMDDSLLAAVLRAVRISAASA